MNRRDFLRNTGIGAAGLMVGCATGKTPWTAKGKPAGANSNIRVAVIGLHKQGKFHIDAYRRIPGVRVVALCDVDEQVLDQRVAELEKENIRVRAYRDLRELFDSKEIDAVSIAMPNHWHALATVWGCQAGKDVLVEKPVSHSIWEGRKMVEAARKYRRMVQGGLNNRSRPGMAATFDNVRSGQLGKILRAYAWDYKRRESIGKIAGSAPIPERVDYNLWTGPAPMLPLLREKLHYDWHWQWATGNGEIGNNGVHWLDAVRWGIGKDHLPRSVMSFGGRYGYVDDGQTPNAHAVVFDYDGIPVIYESRGLPRASDAKGMDDFDCTSASGGRILVPSSGETVLSGCVIVCENGYAHNTGVYDNDGKVIQEFNSDRGSPQRSFINALRSGKRSDLKGEILDGHLSAALCHMGNVPILCGEPLTFDAAKKSFGNNEHATRALDRMVAHLKANKVDVAKSNVIVGPTLHFDSRSERFTGPHADRANLFVKNDFREPFVIREHV